MRKFLCTLVVLCSTLSYAQMDKVLHTSAGFGITITITSATEKPKLGLLAGIGAGLGKELWDSTQPKHDASARDFLATAGGSASAYVLWRFVLNRHRTPKVAKASVPTQPTPAEVRAPAQAAPIAPAQTLPTASSASAGHS
jgi:uncharacterized protein YfiM (DUF2279 family)